MAGSAPRSPRQMVPPRLLIGVAAVLVVISAVLVSVDDGTSGAVRLTTWVAAVVVVGAFITLVGKPGR